MVINGYRKRIEPPRPPLNGPGSNSLGIPPKPKTETDIEVFSRTPTTTERLQGITNPFDYSGDPEATNPGDIKPFSGPTGVGPLIPSPNFPQPTEDAPQPGPTLENAERENGDPKPDSDRVPTGPDLRDPFWIFNQRSPQFPKPGPTIENAERLREEQAAVQPDSPAMMTPEGPYLPIVPDGPTQQNIDGSGEYDSVYVPPPWLNANGEVIPLNPDPPTANDIDGLNPLREESAAARREAERMAWAAADTGGFTGLQTVVPRWDELMESGVDPDDARKLGDAPPVVIDALIEGEISTDFALLADDPSAASGNEIVEALEMDAELQTPETVARTQQLTSIFIGHDGPLVDSEEVRAARVSESDEPFDLEPLLPTFTEDQQDRLDVLTGKVGSEQWTDYIRDVDVGLRASGESYVDYTASMLTLGYINGNALEADNENRELAATGVGLGATGEVLGSGGDYLPFPAASGTGKVLSGLGFAISAGSILHEASNGDFGDSAQDGFEGASLVLGGASFFFGGPPGWILGGASVVTGLISLFLSDNPPPNADTPAQDVLDYQFKELAESEGGATPEQRDSYEYERARFVETSLQLTENRLWGRSAEQMPLDDANKVEYEALWVHANNPDRYIEPGKHVNGVRAGTREIYIFRETDLATGEEFTRRVVVHPRYGILDYESDRAELQTSIDNASAERAAAEDPSSVITEENEPSYTPAPVTPPDGHVAAPTNDSGAPGTSAFDNNSNVNNAGVPG